MTFSRIVPGASCTRCSRRLGRTQHLCALCGEARCAVCIRQGCCGEVPMQTMKGVPIISKEEEQAELDRATLKWEEDKAALLERMRSRLPAMSVVRGRRSR